MTPEQINNLFKASGLKSTELDFDESLSEGECDFCDNCACLTKDDDLYCLDCWRNGEESLTSGNPEWCKALNNFVSQVVRSDNVGQIIKACNLDPQTVLSDYVVVSALVDRAKEIGGTDDLDRWL